MVGTYIVHGFPVGGYHTNLWLLNGVKIGPLYH